MKAEAGRSSPPDATARLTKPLVLTMGDPAGIGLDITLAAWTQRDSENLPPFYVIGSERALAARAAALSLDIPIKRISSATIDTTAAVFKTALPVIDIPLSSDVTVGAPQTENAHAVIASITQAAEQIRASQAAAMVTNPIAKSVLYNAGFAHPGHTEFLAELSHRIWDKITRPVMMLAADEMRVVPVTVHIPLKDVPAALTTDLIIETIEITIRDLQRRHGIASPRVACTGLNPHAGEDGSIGLEENAIIAPAVAELQARDLRVTGPFPADTIFHATARAQYDVIVAMYHDQALIPIKTLAFDRGVNISLGLPFIRTSPDHGTAFPIAGTGTANPRSLIEAIRTAEHMAQYTTHQTCSESALPA